MNSEALHSIAIAKEARTEVMNMGGHGEGRKGSLLDGKRSRH